MKVINNETLIQNLNWRYAVKRFDPTKKLNADDWGTLEQALVLTPSSYGLQPWKFLIVQDPAIRKELRAVSWGQSQVEECSHYVIFLGKNKMDKEHIARFAQRMADVRGLPLESLTKFQDIVAGDVVHGARGAVSAEWAARQIYIALGSLMTCASLLGVDCCPMEGLDPQKYDEILKLTESGYKTVVACAVGYRHSDDKYQGLKKVRFPTADLVEHR